MPTDGSLPTQFAPAERSPLELLNQQSSIVMAEDLLRRVLDALPEVVLILNRQRQIIFANRALLDVLGLADGSALIGLRPGEALGCLHAGETAGGCGTTEFCRTCGAVAAILASLERRPAVEECRIVRQDGEALDLLVSATPLALRDQDFSLFALKDISHEKRRRTLERIFFHDVLNTVGSLRGFTELLQGAAPADLDTLTGAIIGMANRLIEEINAQRELLSAENGELKPRPSLIDSQEILTGLAWQYQNHPSGAGRHLQVAPTAAAVEFTSDLAMLRRVISNLVKNALEASLPGETVTLDCARAGDRVEFRVHNPAFIPRPIQLQIFQRSFSTKGPGRGLGTYSVKLLSERYLHGEVSFTSFPEAGTTFTVRYPLAFPTG